MGSRLAWQAMLGRSLASLLGGSSSDRSTRFLIGAPLTCMRAVGHLPTGVPRLCSCFELCMLCVSARAPWQASVLHTRSWRRCLHGNLGLGAPDQAGATGQVAAGGLRGPGWPH